MLGTLLPCLLATALAAPPSPPPPGEAAPAPDAAPTPPARSFRVALERARELYFDGGHDAALDALVALRDRLDDGEDVPPELRAEALTYLGEVQYQLGDQAGAWETFESLLTAAPDYVISPYHHPTEVIAWFELVRRKVLQGRDDRPDPPEPPAPEPPEPLPAWGYAPFGIPQLGQGQVARGLVYGGLQLGLGITSIATWVHLDRINRAEHPEHLTDTEVWTAVQTRRWAVQIPATAGFYLAWTGSHLDARRSWRARPPAVGLGTDADGRRMVVVSGRF